MPTTKKQLQGSSNVDHKFYPYEMGVHLISQGKWVFRKEAQM